MRAIMSLVTLLLDPRGRVNRVPFWLVFVPAEIVIQALVAAVHEVTSSAGKWLVVGVLVVLRWVQLCVSVKRVHDVDLRAWWIAVPTLCMIVYAFNRSLLPAAGTIHTVAVTIVVAWVIAGFGMLVVGFIDGTVGDNRFGADPLGRKVAALTLADANSAALRRMLAARGYEVRRFPLRAHKIEVGIPGGDVRKFATDVQFVPWAQSELRERPGTAG
jgi:uncharacterized membrane protein YhaH (DUF805 family)